MDELIRKQDALNAFCLDNRMFLPRNSGRTGTYVKMVMDNIKALPPVQPKGTKLSTVCLLCKKPAVTFNTEDDIPYTNYSYCEDCLRKGLKLLKKQINALPPVQSDVPDTNVGDMISRQAAIEAIHEDAEWLAAQGSDWQVERMERDKSILKSLPAAQPKRGKWIPVSERLPKSNPEDLEYPTVIICLKDGTVELGCFYESTKEWGTGEDFDRLVNPVAWMPLPEPWEGE